MSEHTHNAFGIACNHVVRRDRKLNYILHEEDGGWQFLCGEGDGHDSVDEASPICSGCAFQTYVDGLDAADIPPGFAAERPDHTARWVIRPIADGEIAED